MQNKIAAVVVTYNRCQMLVKCMAALLGQSAPCDVLVVDNASTDNTRQAVEAVDDTRVKYRNTGANLGGAGGFNFGMRWAVESGYSYVWLMDDDCLPKPNALEKLLDADGLLEEDYGFLSSVVLWTDGSECKMNHQKVRKTYYDHPELLAYGIVQVEQATFVSLFVPAKTVLKAGLPIKDFFIWGDDIEYTRRLAVRLKYPCYLVGQSQVVHAMKENNGSDLSTDVPERIDRYSYAFRNEAYLYRQEGAKGVCVYLARCGRSFLRIVKAPSDKKCRRYAVLFGSMLKGCTFAPQIEYIKAENEEKGIE